MSFACVTKQGARQREREQKKVGRASAHPRAEAAAERQRPGVGGNAQVSASALKLEERQALTLLDMARRPQQAGRCSARRAHGARGNAYSRLCSALDGERARMSCRTNEQQGVRRPTERSKHVQTRNAAEVEGPGQA